MRNALLTVMALCLLTGLTAPLSWAETAGGMANERPSSGDSENVEEALDSASDSAGRDDGFMAEIAKAEAELEAKQRPWAGVFGNWFTDKNDITVWHGGAYGHATVFEGLKLYTQAMTGPIHQDASGARRETDVYRTSVEFGVEDFFVTPRVVVWGAGLYENFDMQETPGTFRDEFGNVVFEREDLERGYLVGGKLGGKYIFLNGSEIGIEGRRESIWQEHNKYDARLFNRVYDMTQMSADMAINKLQASADVVTFPEHEWRTDGGIEDFEDGNTRAWGYTHYQVPVLWSRDQHWTVIRPNFYVEHMKEYSDAYFSPEYHITVGTMLHTIQEFQYIDIEAEVNPQLLWTRDQTQDGDTGAGVHGLLKLTVKPTDDFHFGVGGFGYADTEEYWLLRGTVFMQYVF